MIPLQNVLAIGYNSTMRLAAKKKEAKIFYSSSLAKIKVEQLLKRFPKAINLNYTGAQIGSKFYKNYCINTLLILTHEKTLNF